MDGGAYTDEADFVIGNSDILIISEEFYSAVFSDDSYMENCRKLTEQGPQIVIVTLGRKRVCASAKRGGAAFQLPPFEGHKIVDTTGAGDVFHGGLPLCPQSGLGTGILCKVCKRRLLYQLYQPWRKSGHTESEDGRAVSEGSHD